MKCNHTVCLKPSKIRVIDQHHRVGCNVPLQDTIFNTLVQEVSKGSHCIQFYLGSQKSYKSRTINRSDKEKTIKYCDKYGKSFYVHCPNITNLARQPDHQIFKNTASVIHKELEQIRDMPASCVVHIGAIGTVQDVVNNVNSLNIARGKHSRTEKQLLLENAAGAGSRLGWSWEQLRHIYEGIDKNTIGFCLDTQHTFGAGINPLQTHEDIVKLFDSCEEVYGRDPDVIHLNDSKVQLGSRKDRHWSIGCGYIWSQGDEGLKYLLDYCYEKDIDLILETPTSKIDLDKIRTEYMDLETIDILS